MTQIKIQANKKNISKAVSGIEKEINNRKISEKNVSSFLLYSEEILLQLIDSSEKENNKINIKICGKKGRVKARFSCPGKELVLDETFIAKEMFNKAELDEEQTVAISRMILKSNSDRLSFRYKRGINYAQVNSAAKAQKTLGLIGFMLLGVVLGLIIKTINVGAITNVSSKVFSMISTMFMNAIKLFVTPLVFFSIADSVSGFSDFGVFGKIGLKIVLLYMIFSLVSIFLGFGMFSIIKPGSTELAPELLTIIGTEVAQPTSVSLIDTIINIIPNGFVGSFVNQEMTQIIFLAIIVGFATGKLGEYSEKVQSFISAGNALFSQLIAIVVKTIKPVCLCMMANVALELSLSSFVQQFKLLFCMFCTIGILFVLYCAFIWIIGKQNPLKFFSAYKKAFFVAFSTMSSSATIPTSMQCCDDMGVSPKIYSFSIPLGATINMNASCIFFVMAFLFVCRILSIPISFARFIPFAFTILLIAISAPGIPGAALATISILFSQVGIPATAIAYIIGIYTLSDGILTAINVTGDAVVTYVISQTASKKN